MRALSVKNVATAVCLGALALGAAGCGSSGSGSGDESGAPAKPQIADDTVAFLLGRKYAFACLYVRLDKPAEADSAIKIATTAATALGVAAPTLPTKDGAFAAMRVKTIPDEITAKKGAKASAAYSLGVAVTDAWFGAMLGSDTASQVAEIERHAKAAGTPETVWKAKYDALKAGKPTDAQIKDLAQALEGHYKPS